MTIPWQDINWAAVAVAAVATFFLGALWYTALFGKLWQRLHGFTPEKVKELQSKRPPAVFFTGMLVSYFAVAVVVAALVVAFGVTSAGAGAGIGLLLWIGPAAAIQITSWLASDKPFLAYGIDLGFQLVFLVAMGALLGGWR